MRLIRESNIQFLKLDSLEEEEGGGVNVKKQQLLSYGEISISVNNEYFLKISVKAILSESHRIFHHKKFAMYEVNLEVTCQFCKIFSFLVHLELYIYILHFWGCL